MKKNTQLKAKYYEFRDTQHRRPEVVGPPSGSQV